MKPYDVCLAALKRNPDATYRSVLEKVQKKIGPRAKLAPVSYGRAKLQLGIVKPGESKRRAAGKKSNAADLEVPTEVARAIHEIGTAISAIVKAKDEQIADLQRRLHEVRSVVA